MIKRLFIAIFGVLVCIMYFILQLMKGQQEDHERIQRTEINASETLIKTTVIYNIFSGFSTTTGIDFIYSE